MGEKEEKNFNPINFHKFKYSKREKITKLNVIIV